MDSGFALRGESIAPGSTTWSNVSATTPHSIPTSPRSSLPSPYSLQEPVSNDSTDRAERRSGEPPAVVRRARPPGRQVALERQRLRELSESGPQPIDGQHVDAIVGDVAPAAEVKQEPSSEG